MRTIPTVCGLAFEAKLRASYNDPAMATFRDIWDTAWHEALRAHALLQAEKTRLARRHGEEDGIERS